MHTPTAHPYLRAGVRRIRQFSSPPALQKPPPSLCTCGWHSSQDSSRSPTSLLQTLSAQLSRIWLLTPLLLNISLTGNKTWEMIQAWRRRRGGRKKRICKKWQVRKSGWRQGSLFNQWCLSLLVYGFCFPLTFYLLLDSSRGEEILQRYVKNLMICSGLDLCYLEPWKDKPKLWGSSS